MRVAGARAAVVLCCALLAGLTAPVALAAPERPAPDAVAEQLERPEVATRDDAVLVRWSAGAPRASSTRAAGGLPGAVSRGGWQVVRGDATSLLERLPRQPGVLAVEPDLRREASGEDPYLAKAQAGSMATVRWAEAWSRAVPPDESTVVAVLDTGVDAGHPDLAGRVAAGYDATGTGGPADDNGHGTMVAGLLGATTDNSEGLAGIASGVRVLPVKVLDAEGYGWDSDIAEGIDWAVAHGADVVNLSLSGLGSTTVLRDAVAAAHAAGVVVVAANGNYAGGVLTYPAAYPGAIGVGATDDSGDTTNYSQWNDTTDLVAPGHRLVTTYGDGTRRGYAFGSGTSFSAALVSGGAALLLSTHPAWTPDQVQQRLTTTAVDSGRRGWDEQDGWGVLDLGAALGAAPRPPGTPPAQGPFEPDDVPARAHWIEPGTDQEASLSPDGDVDWWKVQVDEPSDLATHAELNTGDWPDGLGGAPVVEIFDDQLRPVRSSSQGNGFAWRAGTYYLKVWLHSSSRQIGYRLNVTTYPRTDWGTRDRLWYGQFGTQISSLAVGDVTGDGRDDLLAGIPASRPERTTPWVALAPQLADGRLADGWDGAPGARAVVLTKPAGFDYYDARVDDLELGDVDGDADLDVLAATWTRVHLLRNDGTGSFAEQVLGFGAVSVEVADLDGDGDDDLVTVDDTGTVVRRATSAGFGAPTVVDTDRLEHVTTHDVDADGDLDVVGARNAGTENAVHVLLQGATGGWTRKVTPLDQGLVRGLAVADFVGDGRPEVVTSPDGLSGDVEVRTLAGDGTAAAPTTLDSTPAAVFPSPNGGNLVADDWDGDGRADLFAEHNGYGQVDIVPGGSGGWGTPLLADLRNYMQPEEAELRVGDLDGDGRSDLVEAQYGWPVGVLLQRSPVRPAVAWVRSTSPADRATGVATSASPSVVLGRDLRASSVTSDHVRLLDVTPGTAAAAPGQAVQLTPTWNASTRTLTLDPAASLVAGHTYEARLSGLVDTDGLAMLRPVDQGRPVTWRFTVGTPPADATAPQTSIHEPVGPDFASGGSVGITASEPGSTFECRPTTTVAWFPCQGRQSWNNSSPTGAAEMWFRAVDGAGNADASPLHLAWDRGPGDAPSNSSVNAAVELSGTSGSVTGSSAHASYPEVWDDDLWAPLSHSAVYYRWQAPVSGTLRLSTEGSSFDTVVAVARAAGTSGHPQALGGADDVSAGDRTSRLELPVVAGRDYLIRVAGFRRYAVQSGPFELGWEVVGSDNQAPAVRWTTPAAGTVLSNSVEVTAEVDDDQPDVTVTWWAGDTLLATDREAPWSAWLSTDALTDGPVTLTLRAEDADGAVDEADRSFVVDNGWPSVGDATARLDRGAALSTGGRVPVRVTWTAEDAAGVEFARVWRSVDGGPWSDPVRVDADAFTDRVDPGHDYRWRVAAVDGAGHASEPVETDSHRVVVVDDRSSALRWSRRWSRVDDPALVRGTGHRTSVSGRTVRWEPPAGVELGWVARTRPGGGPVEVSLGGEVAGRVATSSTELRERVVVWVGDVPADGGRTLRLRTLRDREVLVDAFVLLR